MRSEAVIFDLEFTAWEGSQARGWSDPDEYREVVQIGAIKVDTRTLEELDSFNCLVKPIFNPELSSFFCELTNISNYQLAREGLSFEAAYEAFLRFAGGAKLSCYGWDHEVIRENLELYTLMDRLPPVVAGNLHDWFARAGIAVSRTNSGHLAIAAGTRPPGGIGEHDALYDCRSILKAMRVFMSKGMPSPFARPLPVGRTAVSRKGI